MADHTSVWVEKKAIRELRLVLTRKHGSTQGITRAVSEAVIEKAKQIASE